MIVHFMFMLISCAKVASASIQTSFFNHRAMPDLICY